MPGAEEEEEDEYGGEEEMEGDFNYDVEDPEDEYDEDVQMTESRQKGMYFQQYRETADEGALYSSAGALAVQDVASEEGVDVEGLMRRGGGSNRSSPSLSISSRQ